MTTRMLIDARHPEETRVAVLTGNRIEEFDFESAERRQLKGNIYLAKVTRVEPSLQAAFVEFGGNRHGFLAFSEIHPDYYQIPKEDREALLRAEAEEARLMAEEQDAEDDEDGDDEAPADPDADIRAGERRDAASELSADPLDDQPSDASDAVDDHHPEDGEGGEEPGEDDKPRGSAKSAGNGDGDQVEALRRRRQTLRRHYKIQDVIHRRQVLLVQVVKEERGNKGAALTTYMSLAGRYCVLMPNTSHGGGISRKISNVADRKRLKSIMADLKLPRTMGCIVRTAGLSRSRTEIKRDFDYLARLWDGIRETTLASAAPALIYEDSNLVKRAIRDLYTREIDEVIVEGAQGYHGAREYMKLLMPSHARKIRPYADAVPLFQRFGAEDQLSAMYQPLVQLKSGGYLVINPTEALVSIDINSGRSTREHNIEQTATATNLEAAHEIARQLRLRDMAGLVVIDFIDMENGSNIRKVEKAMKEALKNDRARIQVGRISSFGLMEMSRQRLRTGVLEASTRICPHCEGTGFVRTASSAGLSALRLLEETAARGRGSLLSLRASREAAIYVLNRKRAELSEIEDRYGVQIEVLFDGHDEGARMTIDVAGPPPAYAPKIEPIPEPEDFDDEIEDEEEEPVDTREEDEARPPRREARESRPQEGDVEGESEADRTRRRRRRRRRGGRREEGAEAEGQSAPIDSQADESEDAEDQGGAEELTAEPAAAGDDENAQREGSRRRRRGRRGGRRRDGGEPLIVAAGDTGPALADPGGDAAFDAPETAGGEAPPVTVDPEAEAAPLAEAGEPPRPKARRRPRARVGETLPAADAGEEMTLPLDAVSEDAPAGDVAPADPAPDAPKPRRSRRKADAVEAPAEESAPSDAAVKPKRSRRKAASDETAPTLDEPIASAAEAQAPDLAAPEPGEPDATAGEEPANDQGTPRRGWWQRTFGA